MRRRDSRRWLLFVGAMFSVICVIGWRAAIGGAIDVSGRFGAKIDITDGLPPLDLARLDLEITLRAQDSYTSLRASAANSSLFSYLGLADFRQFGPLTLQTYLVFDPSKSSFTYFRNSVRFQLLDVGFNNSVYLPANANQSYDQLSLDGVTGNVRWRSVVRFGLCDMGFRTLTFQANWGWEECGLDLGSSISFSKDSGMERFQLKVTYPGIPFLTFGDLITDFVLSLDFELEEKSVSPQLRTRTTRSSFCLTPMLALDLGSEPLSIDGLEVYGIKFESSLGEGVEFYGATSFTTAKNSELTGYADYFEVYRFSVRRPACCDADASIDIAVYFDKDSTWLFDWGMMTASIDFPLGSKFRWSLEVELPANADWVIQIGWEALF